MIVSAWDNELLVFQENYIHNAMSKVCVVRGRMAMRTWIWSATCGIYKYIYIYTYTWKDLLKFFLKWGNSKDAMVFLLLTNDMISPDQLPVISQKTSSLTIAVVYCSVTPQFYCSVTPRFYCCVTPQFYILHTVYLISVSIGSANGRRRYNVTSSHIGWAHTHNHPWIHIQNRPWQTLTSCWCYC